MKRKSVIFSFYSVVFLFILAFGFSCNKDENSIGETEFKNNGPALKRSESCNDVESYFKDTVRFDVKRMFEQNNNSSYWVNQVGDLEADSVVDDDGSGLEHSETNVQEAGVDEADFVKSDGEYIYIVSGRYFLIFKSWPASELEEISRTKLDGHPLEMFISEDKVIIFSNVWNSQPSTPKFDSRVNSFLKTVIIDVSDTASPVIERETYIEGRYMSSRMIGNYVYVIANTYMSMFDPNNLLYADGNEIYDLDDIYSEDNKKAMLDLVDNASLEELLPKYYDVIHSNNESEQSSSIICPCDNFYIPNTLNGRGVISLITFNLDDIVSELKSVSIISNNGKLYTSSKNLYIAAINFSRWHGPEWNDGDWSPKTYLHKFSLGDSPKYIASGEVKGFVLNQFSMGEYNNYFRIATTIETRTDNWRDLSLSNSIYILEENGSILNVVSKIEDIAKGERIYSARFMGERGFLVTFRIIDPLFTVDLSDPYNPEIKGELEMPGFSTYLHPLGEDHLIGIGQNADEQGTLDGMQLAIYDVSDMSNPIRTAHEVIGTGWSTFSEAMYNHKAFVYYEPIGMLCIPVSHWGWGASYDEFFNGAMLFDVDKTEGFNLLGEIDHSEFYSPTSENDNIWRYLWSYEYQVRRSIFIGEDLDYYLFTISGAGIKVNDIDHLDTTIASSPLPYAWDYYSNSVDF